MRINLILVLLAFFGAGQLQAQGWPSYGGDPGSSKYSSLTQISKDNVDDLEVAWTYRTGEGQGSTDEAGHFGLQVTPILLPDEAGGALVICSAFHRVIALDPATGRVRWEFDPEIELGLRGIQYKCRGVAQWHDQRVAPDASCGWRIFTNTIDQRLIALDARTGQPLRRVR